MVCTVLLVDDYEPNREMLSRRLERAGYNVVTAVNGAEGVARVRDVRPDVVLMDLSMPEMDGVEAWRLICEILDDPPPVIALTATMIRDVQITCLEMGFRDFLVKPARFEDVLAAVQRATQKNAA